MLAPSDPLILSFEDARHIVEEHATSVQPRGAESVPLIEASGRVLAESLHADRDLPPFPRATRDGYAVQSKDLREPPAKLRLIGEIKAGDTSTHIQSVRAGEAVAIMTGAPVPNGANAVVMVEHSSQAGDQVEITKAVLAGENIVPTGAEGRSGDVLLPAGKRLGYAGIALAAAIGCSRLMVYARPRIAVLSTGDEVVDIETIPGPSQIRNSNAYSLAAQVREAGGEAVLLPIARDEPARLRELLAKAFESDLVLISGGVSMGKYDLVEQELAALQADFLFTGAKIQPGKPIVFGRVPCGSANQGRVRAEIEHKDFLGLPGNPISTMVTFELFAKVMVEALAGISPQPLRFVHAKLKGRLRTKLGLKRFLPARLSGEFENVEVELTPWQGSGDIASVARSNCFLVIPPDRESLEAGEWVPVLIR